jgi:hypothetical protein
MTNIEQCVTQIAANPVLLAQLESASSPAEMRNVLASAGIAVEIGKGQDADLRHQSMCTSDSVAFACENDAWGLDRVKVVSAAMFFQPGE